MSSDGWTTADLVFLWKEGDPVQVVKNLHLPRFTLEKFLTDYCNSKTNTGKITSTLIEPYPPVENYTLSNSPQKGLNDDDEYAKNYLSDDLIAIRPMSSCICVTKQQKKFKLTYHHSSSLPFLYYLQVNTHA